MQTRIVAAREARARSGARMSTRARAQAQTRSGAEKQRKSPAPRSRESQERRAGSRHVALFGVRGRSGDGGRFHGGEERADEQADVP